MKITVVGVGHVGLVSAACFARWGHDVVGMDDDHRKIEKLRSGGVPFFEPGLPELLDEVISAGRLTFTTDIAEALDGAEVVFVCVGTPPLPGGGPNLSYVEAVGRNVATHAQNPVVLVEKSTVPANTGARLSQVIAREQAGVESPVAIDVASNPEFLREGAAVQDTLHPDRIVYGTSSERARDALREVYRTVVEEDGMPVVETDVPTAELIKHASNAFLATKISFINAVAQVCERVGADVDQVADGMGFDQRIGRQFLYAGLGYGGSCLLGDESVLARHGDEVRHLTMAELWLLITAEGIDGWEVLSWHPQRRTPEFLPLSAATLRPYQGDVVELRTKMGRRLRCTVDHPFVVGAGDGSDTEVRLAGELTTADWLPLAGHRPSAAGVSAESTSVLAAVAVGVVGEDDVIQRLDAADLEAVRERSSELPTPRRYDVLRNGTIRLEEFRALGLEPTGGSFGTARNGTYVPAEIELDEAFWRVVGLYLAEGHLTVDGRRMRLSWSFHPTDEADLVGFVASYWRDRGVKTDVRQLATASAVTVSSRLLASWFEDVLGLGRDCYRKRLPDLVWEAPDEHKRALLRGLWDGDGSWSLVNGGPSVVLEYGAVSRSLADGMVRLLGDLGVVASVRVGRTAKSTVDTYWLRISGAEQIEEACGWLFPQEEAAEIRATVARQSKRIAPTGYRRFDDGSTWVRVAGVDRRAYSGPVYSLEVPDSHTIVTTGGLVTHNCFPKDVDAFIHLSRQVGYEFKLLEEVERINREQRDHVLAKLKNELWHLNEKIVTLLGGAFKPGTDDLREAPAIHLARMLLDEGATVRIYDPVALANIKEELGDAVELFEDPIEACRGAHAAVVTTEWDEVKAIDPQALKEALAYPIVVDGRNALDGEALAAIGIHYQSIGKPAPRAQA